MDSYFVQNFWIHYCTYCDGQTALDLACVSPYSWLLGPYDLFPMYIH
jgi:hypothetical protein